MGKIRTIKPQFFQDERVGRVPPLARYLLLGAFSLADDNGVFRGHSAFVKAQIFAYDPDVTINVVESLLHELETNGLLLKAVYRGEQYYIIRTFSKHQKIDRRYITEIIPSEIVQEAIREYEEQFEASVTTYAPTAIPAELEGVEGEVDVIPPPSLPLYSPEEVQLCLVHDEIWLDSVCMNNHLDKQWVVSQIPTYLQQQRRAGRAYYDQRDLKRRFTAWIKEKTANNERPRNGGPNDRESRRRLVAERAARRLSDPEDDPPGPAPF